MPASRYADCIAACDAGAIACDHSQACAAACKRCAMACRSMSEQQ